MDFQEEEDSQEVGNMYDDIISEVKKAMADNLLSAVKFGTEGEPNNLLFILEKVDFDTLESIKPVLVKHRKKDNVVPLFFTKEEFEDGLDVFPLEFLDIKQPHELLFGEDIVGKLKPDKKHVRRQLEFELRSKLIHLREHYIWLKKPKEVCVLLRSAVPSLMPLFYGLLFLKDVEAPTELDSLFGLVEKHYKVKLDVMKDIKGIKKCSEEELKKYTKDLIVLLADLGEIVDEMKV